MEGCLLASFCLPASHCFSIHLFLLNKVKCHANVQPVPPAFSSRPALPVPAWARERQATETGVVPPAAMPGMNDCRTKLVGGRGREGKETDSHVTVIFLPIWGENRMALIALYFLNRW